MIIKSTAIPLAYYPYSSTSRIVHWLTRHHGKISTLLKGALRPKSPFLGEYELFGTSELLYFEKRPHTLHTGKECALLHPRNRFRNDWRAMQSASYLSALINHTTPEESPQPSLFELYEELLDWAEEYGKFPQFLFLAELRFCAYHGHAPNLGTCSLCNAADPLKFSASTGGVICENCARATELQTLDCSPDIRSILLAWQQYERPMEAIKTNLSTKQLEQLSQIFTSFMQHQFNINPGYRNTLSGF